jgi:hypothetical protein
MYDIFGKEYNGKRANGLVDCITEAEFEKYAMKEQYWHDDFKIWMTTKSGRIRCPLKGHLDENRWKLEITWNLVKLIYMTQIVAKQHIFFKVKSGG